MSDIRIAIDNPDSPTWLPPPSAIIARCREVGLIVQGFVEHSPDGSESVWIKQGFLIAMGEARTQKFLADVVNSDENCVDLPRWNHKYVVYPRHQNDEEVASVYKFIVILLLVASFSSIFLLHCLADMAIYP